jgi:hypothetical protein
MVFSAKQHQSLIFLCVALALFFLCGGIDFVLAFTVFV